MLYLVALAVLYGTGRYTASTVAVAGAAALALQTLVSVALSRRSESALAGAVRGIRHDDRIDLSLTTSTATALPPGLHQIAREIDGITAGLNGTIREVVSTARKFSLFSTDIYYSGGHLSELSENQANLMGTVLDQAGAFQKDLEDLRQSIQRCLDQIDETSSQYQTLRGQAEQARHQFAPLETVMSRADALAGTGQEHMQQSIASATAIQEEITRLNSRMTAMEQQASEAGAVLGALQSLADTTHVLATNASIVAARAGSAGRGFAVIAGEVRSLAADSRNAISQVEAFLTSLTGEIRESAAVASSGARMIAELAEHATRTGNSLADIAGGVGELRTGMETFRTLFDQQHDTIENTLKQSEEVHGQIETVGNEISHHAGTYDTITGLVGDASRGAATAAHSARVLSQLGTYLRTGGQELSHVVDRFVVSEERFLAGVTRREPRTTLLYNLEVFRDGELLGHLGDISPSGLMILTPEELPVGEPVQAFIKLPLTSRELPDVPITFVPRRLVRTKAYFRIGCSLDEQTSRKQHDDIDMIITNYTVSHGMEMLESASEGAAGGATGSAAGSADHDGSAGLSELEVSELEVSELEEVQELEEIQ